MDLGQLFLETVDDLRRRGERPTEYDVISTAALLRKLLIGSPCLADAVNRERRLRIRYVINAKEPIWRVFGDVPAAYAVEDGFDPETALVMGAPAAVTRDRLLSQPVLAYRGQELTVRDLIQYVAHTAGGVHFDPPRTEQEAAVQAVAQTMLVGGYPAGGKTLLAVARVVRKGLQPLVERIQVERAA